MYPILSLVLLNLFLLVVIIQMRKSHAEALKQTERHYQSVVSHVSHSLAAPLASIHLALQKLEGEKLSKAERDVELRRLLRQSRWASRSCRRLFQLSLWSRERPEPRSQELPLLETLLEVLEVYEDAIIDQNIQLSLDEFFEETVLADPGFLKDILGALLENVLDHSGGKCKMILRTRPEGGRVWVEVEDTGQGASKAALQKLTKPHRFGETSGLGLAVAKILVHAQDGEIRFEGTPDEAGFKAGFSLPKPGLLQ